jgi:hypothetical protein
MLPPAEKIGIGSSCVQISHRYHLQVGKVHHGISVGMGVAKMQPNRRYRAEGRGLPPDTFDLANEGLGISLFIAYEGDVQFPAGTKLMAVLRRIGRLLPMRTAVLGFDFAAGHNSL